MASLTTLTKAYVRGKRLVKPGDTVKIVPLDLREKDKGFDRYSAERHVDFLRRWLGDGPFIISSIGQWPCGQVMLYLKGAITSCPGVHIHDFM